MTLRVGLTGGIGTGKTTVANLFAEHGIPVIDADVVARRLVEPGQPAIAEIVALVGADIIDNQGQLCRSKLRQKIFADPKLKTALEQILHPRIYVAMEQQAREVHAPYCILVVPLLLETGQRDFVQRLLVVDCAPEVQLQRVMARDQLTATEANAIILSQVSRGDRLDAADDVIVNNDDLDDLKVQVDKLHQRYTALSDADFPQR